MKVNISNSLVLPILPRLEAIKDTAQVFELEVFLDFLIAKYENIQLTKGVTLLNESGRSFDFLKDEPDLYSDSDIIG